jgi:nucleotide-binding universal stress UspA family protein
MAIDRIVVALDGSEGSERTLPIVRELATGLKVPVTVVYVREIMLFPEVGGQPRRFNEEELSARVSEEATGLTKDGIEVDLQVVESTYRGGPAHEIAEVARQVGAGLIVAGSRGSGVIAGLLVGSVAHRLQQITPCPVVIVPPARD